MLFLLYYKKMEKEKSCKLPIHIIDLIFVYVRKLNCIKECKKISDYIKNLKFIVNANIKKIHNKYSLYWKTIDNYNTMTEKYYNLSESKKQFIFNDVSKWEIKLSYDKNIIFFNGKFYYNNKVFEGSLEIEIDKSYCRVMQMVEIGVMLYQIAIFEKYTFDSKLIIISDNEDKYIDFVVKYIVKIN